MEMLPSHLQSLPWGRLACKRRHSHHPWGVSQPGLLTANESRWGLKYEHWTPAQFKMQRMLWASSLEWALGWGMLFGGSSSWGWGENPECGPRECQCSGSEPGISLSGGCPARDSFSAAKIEEHICVCLFHKHSLPVTAKIFCPVLPGGKRNYCYHYKKVICFHSPIEGNWVLIDGYPMAAFVGRLRYLKH